MYGLSTTRKWIACFGTVSIVLAAVALGGCSRSASDSLDIRYDLSAVNSSAAVLFAVVRESAEGEVEVLFSTEIVAFSDLEVEVNLPNDPAARALIITYDPALGGRTTELVSPPDEPTAGYVPASPVASYSAPLRPGATFTQLDASDPEMVWLTDFSDRVHVLGVASTATPTPTATPTATPTPTPTPALDLVIDNTDERFFTNGNWVESTYFAGGYPLPNGSYFYTNDTTDATAAIWSPLDLDPGQYEIYAWWQADSGRPAAVTYRVSTDMGTYDVVLDQRINGSQWNSLGTYEVGNAVAVILFAAPDNGQGTCADAVGFRLIPDP